MPIFIVVFGTPSGHSGSGLMERLAAIQKAIVAIPNLGVRQDQVSVFFASDCCPLGLGEEIVGLINVVAKQTVKELNLLAKTVGEALKVAFPEVPVIQCLVQPHDPARGFWSTQAS